MCEHETYLTEELQKRDQLLQRFYALNWVLFEIRPISLEAAEKVENALATVEELLAQAFKQEHLLFPKQKEPEKLEKLEPKQTEPG